jgi:Secretion system C-terminal sorting domain
MKFPILFFLLLISVIIDAQIPGVSWTLQIDGHNTVYLADAITDKEGNSYFALNYTDDIDIPGLKYEAPYADHVHACLLKVSPSGKALWVRFVKSAFDNRITDIAFGQNGDILVTGFGDGTVEFVGEKKSIGEPQTSDGRVYHRPQCFYVSRFSIQGKLQWATSFHGAWGQSLSVVENKLKQIFVTYYQDSNLYDKDNNLLSSFEKTKSRDSKVGIIVLNSAGEYQSIRELGYEASSSGITRLYLQCDNQNNLILYGSIYGTLNLTKEDSITSLNQYISLDGFVAHYNPEGKLNWFQHFCGISTQWIRDVTIAPDNSIYFLGIFDRQCDITSQIKTTIQSETPNVSGYNIFHGRLYPDGEIEYTYFYENKRNSYYISPHKISLDGNNEIHIASTYNDTISFGSETIYANYHNTNSFHSVWQKEKHISLQSIGEVKDHFLHNVAFDVSEFSFCGGAEYYGDKTIFFKGTDKFKLKNRDYGGAIILYGGKIKPKETPWTSPIAMKKPNLDERIEAFKPAIECHNNTTEDEAENTWLPIVLSSDSTSEATEINQSTLNTQTPCGEDILSVYAKAFPNPTRGQLTVEVSGLSGNLKLEMYNSSGQLLLSRIQEDIPEVYQMDFDMSTVASGQYVVVLTTETHRKMLRIEVAR